MEGVKVSAVNSGGDEIELDDMGYPVGSDIEFLDSNDDRSGAVEKVDTETGAPSAVRSAVGAADARDRLNTLRLYYPDAVEYQDNFIYTDPESGNQMLFNPKGADFGDVSENARMLFEFLGGGVGAIVTPPDPVTTTLGAGLGAEIGGQTYDVFADIFYPQVDTVSKLEKAAGISNRVLLNSIAFKAGDVAANLTQKSLGKTAGATKESSKSLVRAFENSGVSIPTAGTVGNKALQQLESALSGLPSSAGIMDAAYSKTLDDINKFAVSLANKVSQKEGQDIVGGSIRSGGKKFVAKFKKKAEALYNNVDKFINPKTRIDTPSFSAQLDDVTSRFADDPEFAEVLESSFVKQLKEANEAASKRGGVTYSTLKSLRTKIGERLDDEAVTDVAGAELKALYGALSDDLSVAAAQMSDDAYKAAQRASQYWRAGRTRIDDILRPVMKKTEDWQVFQAAMSGSKNGGQRLAAIKRSVPKSDWDALVAQQIREMGKTTRGGVNVDFSPDVFLTSYKKLSPAARNVLFSGKNYKELESSIDDFLKVSSALQEASKEANRSNTAKTYMYMTALTSGLPGMFMGSADQTVAGMAAGAAAVAIPSWATAKLTTSPKFIKWLTEAGKTAPTEKAMAAHMGLLTSLAEDEDIGEAVRLYLTSLRDYAPQAEKEAQ